jgi:serine/threonine protein kinase
MNLIKRTDKNLIFGKFKVTKVIGSGSFGEVYEGYNIIDNQPVAIKVEDKSHNLNLLEKEGFYLYTLKGPGVPEVISFGYSGKYNILVQTLLGQSLGKIFFEKKHYFSIKDICMFSIQILERIEFVHSKFIIHRDIKPENFLIGRTDAYNIYIIDFGLSKKYKSSRTNKHIQFRLTRKFTGTARYASANSVRGGEQSRRDDLEAIGYMLLYFFSGARLPWQGVSCKEKAEKYSKIYTMKKELDLEDFCKKMPREIIDYMNYCKKLEFQENPNYAYLRGLFENVLKRMGTSNDLHFSWIKDTSVCKNVRNLSKKKASPQFRIFKQLKNSKDKPELIKKSLTTGKPLKNVQDEKLSNNQKIIIHKRFNSSGDYIYLKHNES